MPTLKVCMFGKFHVRCDGQVLDEFANGKWQELFAYLLLHRSSPQPRERLATLLWENSSTAQAAQYLRQSLWKLQTKLNTQPNAKEILLVDHDWIRFNPDTDLWLDVAVFEQSFALVQRVPGAQLGASAAQALQMAVELYQGDLLEGWYQDWCLGERERLRNMYLAMLYKLMGYCEAQGQGEQGVSYGETILRHDYAQERTHRSLMRLRYRAGDRTGALRQYAQCAAALQTEFGVAPSQLTTTLYQQMQADQMTTLPPVSSSNPVNADAAANAVPEVLNLITRLQMLLPNLARLLQSEKHIPLSSLPTESEDTPLHPLCPPEKNQLAR